jgi:hypothetical protein
MSMSENVELDAWLDGTATLLGISVSDEWRETVRQHLRITHDLAKLIMDFPLPDEADPAPVFRA